MLPALPRPGQRALVVLLLALPVAWLHLQLTNRLIEDSLGQGAKPSLRRMQLSFVLDLQPTLPMRAPRPPATAVQPRPVRAAPTAAQASVAASAPASAAAAVVPVQLPESPAATGDQQTPPTLTSAQAATTSTATAEGDAPAPPVNAFEWPPSTRLSYTLTGNFRGPVEGQARVEWLQQNARYQVHLDVSVGPAFAPLVSRRMSSEGEVGSQGLRPLRYEEETRVVMRPTRQLAIRFDDQRIILPSGSEGPRPPGVQDSASQFVQMTWLFTTQPQLMQAGRSIELPLALPRRVEPWTYDVLSQQTLHTPAGVLDTWHVKPRRPAREGDLTAEFWVAPSLQNLPVRILIRQDEETFVDLLLERLPQQAAQPATTNSAK